MKDSKGNLVQGRTRWRRFAAVVIPATVAVGGLLAGVANGAVPVAVNVSGQSFKISATALHAEGFAQYGSAVVKPDGTQIPVAAASIKHADITNLCQSVKFPGLPLTMVIRAGREAGKPAQADNLIIGMDYLVADATFHNIDIGVDASKLSKGADGDKGLPGGFGQQADTADLTNVKQRAYSTHAGTFKLVGLSMSVQMGVECFADSDLN